MKFRDTLCCLDRKEIEANIDEIAKIVSNAKYICRRCARVSQKKKHLCKPKKLASKAKEGLSPDAFERGSGPPARGTDENG